MKNPTRSRTWTVSITLFVAVSSHALAAGPTSLVADINVIGDPSDSLLDDNAPIVRLGSQFLFVADDGIHGDELWITDTTGGGTTLLMDLWPGPNGSGPQHLTVFGGEVFFSASDGSVVGKELWKTDGTLDGTTLVKDIHPTTSSSIITIVATPELLFLRASDATAGSELWKSDGTTAGTQLVEDINVGLGSGQIGNLTPIGSKVFFFGDDGSAGNEPWVSDGTPAGTFMLEDIFPGGTGSNPSQFTARAGNVYFVATDDLNGTELWVTDGTTAFVQMVEDLNPGSVSSTPSSLFEWNGDLYFSALADAALGRELYRFVSPGTGIELLKEIGAGSFGSSPTFFTDVGPRFFFAAHDGVDGRELWSSDGTPAGTELFADVDTGPQSSTPTHLTATSTQLFFVADDGTGGQELWRTDGTPGGTMQVLDIEPAGDSDPFSLTPHPAGGIVFGAHQVINGTELWRSNGTASGTLRITDLGDFSSNPIPISQLSTAGSLLLSADDGTQLELWASDGTAVGTSAIADLLLVPQYAPPQRSVLPLSGGGAFYAVPALGAGGTAGLYFTDGTAVGTEQLLVGFPVTPLEVFGDEAFFSYDDALTGEELWKTDGSVAGTTLVKDIASGDSLPREPVALDDRLVFVATVDEGAQLWMSDGTTAGTSALLEEWHDDHTGTDYAFADLHSLTRVGDSVFFFGELEGEFEGGGGQGVQVWKSDGTAAGTMPVVTDLRNGVEEVTAYVTGVQTAARGDDFFFAARDDIAGQELWMSDGTESGTGLVLDIVAGAASSSPSNLTTVGDTVFFSACDPVTDHCELWSSDGTAGGTSIVLDIGGPTHEGRPQFLTAIGDRLYFVATGALVGRELWQSDGTPTGTTVAADIHPGSDSSDPSGTPLPSLLVLDGTIYFSATDGTTGREVWRHEAAADLEMSLSLVEPPAFVGALTDFDLTVLNHGPADASEVTVTMDLPLGATFDSSEPPGICNESSGVVTCQLSELAASAEDSVEVTLVLPLAPGVLDATAGVDAWDPDVDFANDESTLSFEVHQTGTLIFSDGFESGDVSAWSSSS